MRTITLQQLEAANACADQRDLFAETFPSGETPPITCELCEQYAGIFDFRWAGAHLLSAAARTEYNYACAPAWAVYLRACAAAWAWYELVRAAAGAERTTTADRAEYDRACALARAEYDRAIAPAQVKYNRACAAEFGRLYAAGG